MKYKFNWLNPKLKVQKTVKYDFGTFAKENIKKGDLLLVLSGYVMKLSEEEKLPGSLSDNGIQVTGNLSLCVSKKEELGGINFFNHSCDPNVGIKGQIFLVAMRNIKKGEETTFDYAMTLCRSKNAKPYSLNCLCGKENCRGIVTDSDWKILELQKNTMGISNIIYKKKLTKQKNDLPILSFSISLCVHGRSS